jgi:hypothetical protein
LSVVNELCEDALGKNFGGVVFAKEVLELAMKASEIFESWVERMFLTPVARCIVRISNSARRACALTL